jgi:hypothetical protein
MGIYTESNRGDNVSTIVWIALPFAVLGSIKLLVRAAMSNRPAVRTCGQDVRPPYR